MAEDRELVEAKNITLLPSHWATIYTFAKDRSYASTSAALRRIIDEWVILTARHPEPTNGSRRTATVPQGEVEGSLKDGSGGPTSASPSGTTGGAR